MNKIGILLVGFLIMCFQGAVGQNTASQHMTDLNGSYKQIQKDTWDYIKKASKGRNAGKIEKRRLELIQTLRSSKFAAIKVKPFEGDRSLKDAVISFLDLNINVINDDFQKIVDLEKIAEDSYDYMEAYILLKERVNAKIDSASQALSAEERSFAERNNINLIEAEETRLSQKIKNASRANKYYNKLYLIFYRSHWYEQEMLTALAAGNAADAEQFRQSLEAVSAEGKEALSEIPAYQNDRTLKTNCMAMLDFFENEAVNHAPGMINFYVEKEDKEKTINAFSAKKKSEITQQDVDQYNAAVGEYNELVNSYNKTNEYLNKKRGELIKKWQNSVQNFFNKFV